VAAGSILVATKSYEYGVANPTHDEVQLSMCDIAAQCAHYKHPREQNHTDCNYVHCKYVHYGPPSHPWLGPWCDFNIYISLLAPTVQPTTGDHRACGGKPQGQKYVFKEDVFFPMMTLSTSDPAHVLRRYDVCPCAKFSRLRRAVSVEIAMRPSG